MKTLTPDHVVPVIPDLDQQIPTTTQLAITFGNRNRRHIFWGTSKQKGDIEFGISCLVVYNEVCRQNRPILFTLQLGLDPGERLYGLLPFSEPGGCF